MSQRYVFHTDPELFVLIGVLHTGKRVGRPGAAKTRRAAKITSTRNGRNFRPKERGYVIFAAYTSLYLLTFPFERRNWQANTRYVSIHSDY